MKTVQAENMDKAVDMLMMDPDVMSHAQSMHPGMAMTKETMMGMVSAGKGDMGGMSGGAAM